MTATDPHPQEPDDPAQPSEGCAVKMDDNQLCRRPIHLAAGIDGENLCLMHSRDPNKDNKDFQAEFEDILKNAEAEGGVADFQEFVFPEARYVGHRFNPTCNFTRATFTRGADFDVAKFAQGAIFDDAAFTGKVSFFQTTFTGEASFDGASFMRNAVFGRATFTEEASFAYATFMQDASFIRAKFSQNASFFHANFAGSVSFGRAKFSQEVNFVIAMFMQDARFSGATFTGDAAFVSTTFTQSAEFSEARFNRVADFKDAQFLDAAKFRKTHFRDDPQLFADADNSDTRESTAVDDDGRLPGPIFTRATFERPEKVEFSQTHLGRALLHKCDVSEISFSDVTWHRRRGRNGRRMIFEEEIELGEVGPSGTTPSSVEGITEALHAGQGDPNERNYGLIAEIYRQLKKNYDDRRDYSTAADFYYGEMEMKRLASPHRIRAFRWWHRNLGLVAWYKYASAYGGSYIRPVVMLLVVLFSFTMLFPWAGLDQSEKPPNSVAAVAGRQNPPPCAISELSYRNFTDFIRAYPGGRKWVAPVAFFGNSLMTALSVAGFQKELKYEPSYPWGRALALMELLLTSTLIALFLLAVRRQFTR
jgi:hypothetical protein